MDSLETDNMTAIQSQYAGQVPFALGQAALFLYADYPFYAGLVTNPIRWGVIDGGQGSRERNGRRNFFTMKIGNRGAVYWAYAIGSDSPSKSATVQEMLAKWQ
jgi:hypothetical protein